MTDLTDADLRQLAEHGLGPDEVLRQLQLFRHPPAPARLDRACAVGDGIVRLPESRHYELLALFEDAAGAGRFSKLVPASGAASRMFRPLFVAWRDPQQGAEASRRLWDELDRFAFAPELDDDERRDERRLLQALFAGRHDFGSRPKALVPFHRYGEGFRTAFAEHLAEAAGHVRDASGRCRLHFTVTAGHEDRFRRHLAAVAPGLGDALGVFFEVDFSVQAARTDTVAADLEGRPFRGDDGRLVLRPGGHGALLDNLARLAGRSGEGFTGDLVFVKNIDNVVPDHRRAVVLRWKKLLAGHLLALERCLVDLLDRLSEGVADRSPDAAADRDRTWSDGLAFLREDLGEPLDDEGLPAGEEERRRFLIDRLDRPLRVCGVVANSGEPGGGPFWVRDHRGGISRQIVETSQIDRDDPAQDAILAGATHFNPVDLVCRLRDHRGRPYDLRRFVDRKAVFVSQKFQDGRPLLALEHPGLWNGSMAWWNTVFVEVPAGTFAPVKTVFDLLRPEHQPAPLPA